MKKYELTSESKSIRGKTLFRIRALVSFGAVCAGDLGGWIEKVENLDQSGDAWVSGNAKVYGDARVYENAKVSGSARVFGAVKVFGDAMVSGNAILSGEARVYGNAWVAGNAWVHGNAQIYGDAWVYGNAWVRGSARVYERGAIFWIGGIGPRNGGAITFFVSKEGSIWASCGWFFGPLDVFAAKVKEKHWGHDRSTAYMLAIEMAKALIDPSRMPVDEDHEQEPVKPKGTPSEFNRYYPPAGRR